MDDQPTQSNAHPLINKEQTTPTTTDDESTITTSTASDTFESWTLVTDTIKDYSSKLFDDNAKTTADEIRIEDLKNDEGNEWKTSKKTTSTVDDDDEEEEQEDEPPPNYDAATATTSATDEFSDEVSIISESDSGDMLIAANNSSMHPNIDDHLLKLNLKFTTGVGLDLPTLLQQQQLEEQRLQQKRSVTPPRVLASILKTNQVLKQRRRRSPPTEIAKYSKTVQASTAPSSKECKIFLACELLRNIIRSIKWIVLAVLIIGFNCILFGAIRYELYNYILPDANPILSFASYFKSQDNVDSLRLRVDQLHQDNEILKEELSFLGRQIMNLNAAQMGKKFQMEYRQHSRPNWMPLHPQYLPDLEPTINKANEDPAEIFQNYKTEQLQNDPYRAGPDILTEYEKDDNNDYNKQQKRPKNQQNSKKRRNSKESKENSGERGPKKQPQQRKERNNKKNDNSNERVDKHNKNFGNSEERSHETDNSKERFDKRNNNNFKQRFNRKAERDNSEERRNNYNRNDNYEFDNSKERQPKNNRNSQKRDFNNNRYDNSKERNKNSNDHKYPKQEHQGTEWQAETDARHQRDQYLDDEKNWYFNRQESREQWRNSDRR